MSQIKGKDTKSEMLVQSSLYKGFSVKKGNDNWEIGRDANTKVKGDLKVGSKVTIYYSMVATEVEVKPAKSTKDSDDKSKSQK